jgi:hypothetical protein
VIDYMADLVGRLHDVCHYAYRHLKVTDDRAKDCYDCVTNCAVFQALDLDHVWLYQESCLLMMAHTR